jgi:hypothetical protein
MSFAWVLVLGIAPTYCGAKFLPTTAVLAFAGVVAQVIENVFVIHTIDVPAVNELERGS